VAFQSASAAIGAAAAAQRGLTGHAWPPDGEIRVRMGIHSGEAIQTGGDFVGLALHQVARITNAGHGGQVLVSEATRGLATTLPDGLTLRDLGERRLKDLASPERLYQLVGDGLTDKFPPLRTLDTKQNNLPVQVTSFVGRDELESAAAALGGSRLLTLTGPGGTGKTRLALQLAAEASDDFPDGVFFVGLDSIREANLVPSVIASTLGLATSGGTPPIDALVEYLRERAVLLVLDNFEQVVDAANDVSRIIREAPAVKVIVTTRIPLRIYGEQEFPVPPLGMPPTTTGPVNAAEAARYEAVRLFVERAMAVQPQFALTDENAQTIVEIVQRVDGLPLAIELAAARTRVLPVSAVRARLDQHLTLLTGGSRDLPERQQTLRGAIDWSYDLLEAADQRLFERFSVHAGGAYLTQADEICGPPTELGEDVLDGLSSLAEKSLVRSGLDGSEDPRFTMLATIRSYAHERLEATEDYGELERRHAIAYLQLAESIEPEILGPEGGALADRLAVDHDNLRSAIDWAVANDETDIALRYLAALWRFWQTRGHLDEARRRAAAILAMPGVADQDPAIVSRAFGAGGGIAYWQARIRDMHAFYKRALEEAEKTTDKQLIAQSTYNFGFAPTDEDQPTRETYIAGGTYMQRSLELFQEIGDKRGIADAEWALSIYSVAMGGPDGVDVAIAHSEVALTAYRELNVPFGTAWATYLIGSLQVTTGRAEMALPHFREALEIFIKSGDQSGILLSIAAFGTAAERAGDFERATRLGGAAERLRDETGTGLVDSPVPFLQDYLPAKPTTPELLAVWEEGRRLSTDEAIQYALETTAE